MIAKNYLSSSFVPDFISVVPIISAKLYYDINLSGTLGVLALT